MRLPGWKFPVVVDLAGMTIPDTVPLLADHNNSTASRVGVISAKVENNQLVISGEIVAEGDLASGIVAQGKAGADWQLSIGASVQDAELVKGKRTVNGMDLEGTFYHVIKSTLREVSVVAVGADSTTKMTVSAKFNLKGEVESMNENEKKVEAAAQENASVQAAATVPATVDTSAEVAAQAARSERERVVKIKAICNGEFDKIEAQAIEEGWSPEATTEKVLAAFRTKQPVTAVNISVKKNDGPNLKTLEAAMCLRAGIDEDSLVKDYGEKAVEMAWDDRDMSIRALMGECLRLEGMDVSTWCEQNNVTKANYYYRLKRVRQMCLD